MSEVLRSVAGRDKANRASSTIEMITESSRSWPSAGVCKAAVNAGIARMKTASTSIRPRLRLCSPENFCLPCLRPPARKANPSTSKTLASIEPTIVERTTSSRPALRLKIMTNSSGRLPSALCKMPVAAGPSRSPSASTLRPTSDAITARAAPATTNRSTELAPMT